MKIFYAAILTITLAAALLAQTSAEVIVPTTFLRKAPNSGAEKIQTVQKGERINVEKARETNGWYYASTANGKFKGWISVNTVRLSPGENVSRPPQKTAVTTTKNPAIVASSETPAASSSPATTNPPEVEEVVRVATEEIILNVRVVDAANRTVKNLNQSQFQIFEDGVLQPITSLTRTEAPVVSALLIDNSRSLRSQLSKIIEAGKIIVGDNRPQDATTVIRFVSSDKIEVVQDFTANKNSLNGALENLFVEGGQTAIVDALYKTAQKVEGHQASQNKEDAKVRAVIIVSDGDDRASSFNEQQLFDLLRSLNVQIYAIGFPNELSDAPEASGISRREKAKSFLQRLAQETGGKVYFPLSINELPLIASDISVELRTQYQISYTPTSETGGGNFRKISVTVAEGENKEKRTAITRAGRTIAPK